MVRFTEKKVKWGLWGARCSGKGPLQYKGVAGLSTHEWAVVNPELTMCYHSNNQLRVEHGICRVGKRIRSSRLVSAM